MGAFTYIETDTGTNVDISAATAVGAYTSTGDKLIMVDVSIGQVAGNGDYVMYVTRQIGGSGSAYRILPQTTMAAASGLTAISAQSGWITVRNGDVLTCYVDGLAGDTATPDWTTRWFELAGVTAAAVADAVWDEATADHTTASSFGALDTNVDAILADTGTDGVVLKAAGLDADAVAEIQSGLALEATLTAIKGAGWVSGDHLHQIKTYSDAIYSDLVNGGRIDLLIDSIITHLTQIKGAGWSTETLVALKTAIDNITGGGATAQQIWEYATRTLTNLPTMPTDWVTAAGLKADAVTEIQSGLATAAALDAVDNFIDTEVAAILAAVDTEVAAIKAKTDNLPASPAAVGSAMTLTAAYDKAKDDVLTPLAVVDSIVDGLKTTLDNIHDTDLPAVKTETAAIKAKTDNLPATPAVADEYDAALAAIQADLDNPNQYKADVSGLATQASVNAIPTTPLLAANYTAPDNASIAAILEDTGTTIPATLAGLATSAEVGAIALLGETVIGSYTVQDILKILAAKMVGKATGGSTATITYRGVDDTSDVIIETVDSNGNRSAVTLTV